MRPAGCHQAQTGIKSFGKCPAYSVDCHCRGRLPRPREILEHTFEIRQKSLVDHIPVRLVDIHGFTVDRLEPGRDFPVCLHQFSVEESPGGDRLGTEIPHIRICQVCVRLKPTYGEVRTFDTYDEVVVRIAVGIVHLGIGSSEVILRDTCGPLLISGAVVALYIGIEPVPGQITVPVAVLHCKYLIDREDSHLGKAVVRIDLFLVEDGF